MSSIIITSRIELVTDPPGLTYKFEEGNKLSVDLYAASYSLREDRLVHTEATYVTGSSK